MALSNEERILCAVITQKDVQPLLERNVGKEWFFNSDLRPILQFVLEHYEKHGKTPSVPTMRAEYPDFKVVSVTESIDYLLEKQAEWAKGQEILAMMEEVGDELRDDDPLAAEEVVRATLTRLQDFSPMPNRIIDLSSGTSEEWDDYLRRKAGGGLLGYTTGFPTIDKTTLGLQNGHLVTIVAQKKVGKTSLCLKMADHIWQTYDVPILFASFEMGENEIRLRQRSFQAGISFKDLQTGSLNPDDEERYEDLLRDVAARTTPFHFMDASSGNTVSGLRAQIEKLEPKVVFVDGIYMMTDEISGETNSSQALTNITRSLKRLAREMDLPVVINTQALDSKSKGARITTASIGYSSSFGQDSDVVLGMEKIKADSDPDASSFIYQRLLRVLASRNTGQIDVELLFDYSEGRLEEAGV